MPGFTFTAPQLPTLSSRQPEAPTAFQQSHPILILDPCPGGDGGSSMQGVRFYEDFSSLPEVYFEGIRQYSLCPFFLFYFIIFNVFIGV